MKKFKKLNRKGFTLIELLAVIVILAVVMGIAANSILSSMNKSRMGSLADSALVVARGMDQKLLEGQVDGSVGSVALGNKTYDFSSSKMYYLNDDALTEYKLKLTDYVGNGSSNITAVTTYTGVSKSFVVFAANKFTVCLVAKNGGGLWVDNLKTANTSVKLAKASSGFANDITFAQNVMFACSDGTKSK